MKMILLVLAVVFAVVPADAALRIYNSSGQDLGNYVSARCGTGLTCAQSAGLIDISSSPSLTSALTISGAEATDAVFNMAADEADDNGDTWRLTSVASGNAFTLSNNTSGSQVAKITVATTGAVTFTNTIAGHLAPQVAATATTITAAQCGSTFSNSGAVQMELPEASTVIGCTLTFVTLNASNFDVNPDNGDQVLTHTNAAGDAFRNATVGNSTVIRAVSASQWAVLAVNGTYTDIN